MTRRMLIVDDELTIRWALRELFMQDGWQAHVAQDGDEAAALIEQDSYDLLITDLRMPGRPGTELAHILRKRNPQAGLIILTGYPSVESAVEAIRLRAWDYLTKPVDAGHLRRCVEEFARYAEQFSLGRSHLPPMGLDGIRQFLKGEGATLLGPMLLEGDGTAVLAGLRRAFSDLGLPAAQAERLLQACVEAAAAVAGRQGATGRAGLLAGHVLFVASASPPPAASGAWADAAAVRVRQALGVDMRVVHEDGICSYVVSERL